MSRINAIVTGTGRRCRPNGSRLLPLEPLGLCREDAAAFIGISPSKFDELVGDGRMPEPRQADRRVLWSRIELVEAFDALPRRAANTDDIDPWNNQCA